MVKLLRIKKSMIAKFFSNEHLDLIHKFLAADKPTSKVSYQISKVQRSKIVVETNFWHVIAHESDKLGLLRV